MLLRVVCVCMCSCFLCVFFVFCVLCVVCVSCFMCSCFVSVFLCYIVGLEDNASVKVTQIMRVQGVHAARLAIR